MKKKEAPPDTSRLLSRLVLACGLIVAIGGGVLVEGQVERYLMREPRFALERAPEYGDPPPNLHIEGLHYASRDAVMRVFEKDLGQSVFLLPLKERRLELMALPWVKDAAVARLWPNSISVKITERKPLAFVKRRGGAETTVIDIDGVLMEAPPSAALSLPVVEGVGPDVELLARRLRIHRVDRLLKELGPAARDLGEINATDVENLKAMQPFRGRAVTLVLGNRDFLARYEKFLGMADQLLERLPNATIFDLRLEDQVTAAEGKD